VPKNIKKIAILRANALGDFLVTLPAVEAIRKRYPGAEMVLLGKPWHKEFVVPGRTPIDRVTVVPVMKGIRDEMNEAGNAQEQKLFFESMQDEQFDIAIHFQGNGVSANPFLKSLKAGMTVGLKSENAEPLDRYVPFYYYQSEVLRYLEVAALIDAKTNDPEPRIDVLDQDEEEIKGLVSLLEKPFVVLHPFSVDIRRSWPAENFAPLADSLIEKKLEVVFTGSKEDSKGVRDIISKMSRKAINACGSLSIGGLAALLKHATLVIAPDTGPLHLARAVNTPTVGIYWAPNLINWGPLSRSIHRPVIGWNMTCPFCGVVPNDPYPFLPQNGCEHLISFVRDVTVEAVREAAEGLLFKQKSTEKRRMFLCKKSFTD
jgi:ADP-heptose:LPS heptosyltransferase